MARKASPANAKKMKEARRQMMARVTKATGAGSAESATARLMEVMGILPLEENDEPTAMARTESALQTLEELAPRDEFERLLVTQMLAVHNATMECFRRAMISGQSFERGDSYLKNAQKLSANYVMQLEALNRHRGKGQQKVTVEHVTVAAGGQAIVGNVDRHAALPASRPRSKVAPPQLTHQVTVAPPPVNGPQVLPIRARTRRKPEHG